ncbi:MAG: peptidoglycan D,D-transpeptidase FtsI family protein [Syntrophothermus sp.]
MPERMRRATRNLFYGFAGAVVLLALVLGYWHFWRAPALEKNPYNPRLVLAGQAIPRGAILDRAGNTLAKSVAEGGRYRRVYLAPASLSQVVGYAHPRLGVAGLELAFNDYLVGSNAQQQLAGFWERWLGRKQAGNDLFTTIDLEIQKAAADALGGRRGAVIALSVGTGEILASVSEPGFNPNELENKWDKLAKDPESPLLNRAVQGLYPPGSAFKVLIAAAGIDSGLVTPETIYDCKGVRVVGKDEIHDFNNAVHGELTLTQALAVSCNYTFSGLGLQLGKDRFFRYANQFRLEDPPAVLGISANAGRLPGKLGLPAEYLAEIGIGQGRLLVTPLEMALVAETVANNGVMMEPFLVREIRTASGRVVASFSPRRRARPISAATARVVREMMEVAVREGTGRGAQVAGVRVAGKTGTADNPHGRPHAWFIGFVPADAPKIALAVVVENAGTGGGVAAPIAARVFETALRQ